MCWCWSFILVRSCSRRLRSSSAVSALSRRPTTRSSALATRTFNSAICRRRCSRTASTAAEVDLAAPGDRDLASPPRPPRDGDSDDRRPSGTLERRGERDPRRVLPTYSNTDSQELFTARCTLVQSAVLRSHVVRLSVCPSVRLSVCNVGGSGPHSLEILETNCTNN